MRRTVGPSYERCPAERAGRWLSENIVRVAATIVAIIGFSFLVDVTVDRFLNFLELGYEMDETPKSEYTFHSDAPAVDWVKVIMSALLVYLICIRNPTK